MTTTRNTIERIPPADPTTKERRVRRGSLMLLALLVVSGAATQSAFAGGDETPFYTSARADSAYPVNPYNTDRTPGASERRPTFPNGRSTYPNGSGAGASPRYGVHSAPRISPERFDRNEYPQGPFGPRHVKITLTPRDLRQLVSHVADKAQAIDRQYSSALTNHDRVIRDYSQRLATLERQRHLSRRHFEAWLDIREYVRKVARDRETIRQNREQARAWYTHLQRRVVNAPATTVIWNVQNPQRRSYVPASYLRSKAIKHVAANLDRLGKTTHLSF